MVKTLCSKCHLKKTCSELCETAESFVSQDYVRNRHGTFTVRNIEYENGSVDTEVLIPTFTTKEKIIYAYFIQRVPGQKISRKLQIPQSTVYYHVKRFKKKIASLLKRNPK